jgi:hypothetical protein
MTNEPKVLRDGFLSLIGGQDSGRQPSLLEPTQAAYISNGMVRGGFLETRFGFRKAKLTFENDEQRDWFRYSLFQGMAFFDPDGHSPMFITSIGGRIFRLIVKSKYKTVGVTEITPVKGTQTSALFNSPPVGSSVTVTVSETDAIQVNYPVIIRDGRYTVTAKTLTTITVTNLDATPGLAVAIGTPVYYLNPNPSLLHSQIWTLQAENFLLIQNGSDPCIIYDGATCRRAVRTGSKLEVPTGTAMAYWQGRIWVAVNKREIEAGNIFEDDDSESILQFTETLYLAEGGRFRAPDTITALRVLPVLDTSLGQGPLQIHTRSSVSSLNLPVERARWKDIDSPVQPIGLINYGARSDNGTIVINGDVWFRASDGLRSFVLARREFGSWGNVPASREMQRTLNDDDDKFLQYGSAILFKNLLLFTVNPLPVLSGRTAYWRGLGVLDFDLLSSMAGKAPPVYPGVWSGVNVMQIVKGNIQEQERAFMCVRNAENINEFWEIDPENRFDGDGGRIKGFVETREMDFGQPLSLHELFGSELWVDMIQGKVNLALKFRPGSYPCWLDWGEREICSVARECEQDCFTFTTLKPTYRNRLGFGTPPDTCISADKHNPRLAYTHAARLEFEGHVRIKALLLKALIRTEAPNAECS